MHETTGRRETGRMQLARWWWPALALGLALAAGCASDGFVAPDGGTTSSGGSAGGGNHDATGGTTVEPKSVVEVCSALCKAQYAGRCQRVEIRTEQCDGVCSFLEVASAVCQASTKTAFDCQLANDPCKTTNCNDLLRKAETDCPEKPW